MPPHQGTIILYYIRILRIGFVRAAILQNVVKSAHSATLLYFGIQLLSFLLGIVRMSVLFWYINSEALALWGNSEESSWRVDKNLVHLFNSRATFLFQIGNAVSK